MTQAAQLTLGFVPIARPTFDIPLATEITGQMRAQLEAAGFVLVGPDHLIQTIEQAQEAAQMLSEKPLDLLLIFQATFADSTIVMNLAQTCDVPLLLWAVPEAPNGGRLRLNSLCGITLAGHSLTRDGRRYDTVYALPDDADALSKIQTIAQAGRVRRWLRGARIGLVGEHPVGFDTCHVDDEGLKRLFGLDIIRFDLQTVFEQVRALPSSAVDALLHRLSSQLAGLTEVDQTALRGTLGTYLTLHTVAEQDHLEGFAVRCWPEFFTELGCAACGASSLLNDELTPASCEADVNGVITQLILQGLSGEPAFDSDIVSFDLEQNTAVFWHCGKAPLSIADPTVHPKAALHSNRQKPLLMEFPLKPGRVTVARLSEATGSYRLVIGSGEVIRSPISFTGTSGVVRFDRPACQVLDTLLSEGLEHHLALTYGEHVESLGALARMLDIPVLRL